MTKGLATRRPFIVDINTRSLPLQLVENTWWWICHSSRKSEKNFKALISSYLTLALFFFTLLLRIQPNFSSVTFASLVLILYNIWSLIEFSCLPLLVTRGNLGSFGVPHKLHQLPQTTFNKHVIRQGRACSGWYGHKHILSKYICADFM